MSFQTNSIRPNNEQVHMMMTAGLYSSNEHHSASSSLRWREERQENNNVPASKLCLLIALLLGWLLMDITLHAVPQASESSIAFWNEQSRDVALKLVQRAIIHHVRCAASGSATVPTSASHNGVRTQNATLLCCTLHQDTKKRPLLHLSQAQRLLGHYTTWWCQMCDV